MKKGTNHNNPWLDIASYSINDANRFKGREKAIVKFSGIVNSGIMSVLYANSGIGKTSFLNAGIDPLMIQKGYFPIHIVFPDEIFLSGHVIEKWLIDNIKAQSQKDGRKWESTLKLTEEEQHKTNDILDKCSSSLWWMLHTYNLVDGEGKQSLPLLIFDQFEEVFVKSRKFGNTVLESKLFQVIEELSNSSFPSSKVDIPEKLADKDIFLDINYTANYKVIFSLRKEYVSDFDYWTQDRFSISELQQNRMLLLPLTRKQALRVITEQPALDGEGYVQTLNSVQQHIIDKLDPKQRNEVEPFLLSVLCSRLYDMAQKDKKVSITVEDLSIYDIETIILHFYEEKISQIIKDPRHLSHFENVLVDKDGSRNRVKIKELSSIEFDNYQTALEKEHLIRKDTFNGEEVYVELIHDRIADAIMKKRVEGNKERTRRLKVLSAAMLLVGALLFIGIPYQKSIDDCKSKTKPIDTISNAYTAMCDSVLELNNVYVKKSAFYTNPFVKTVHIKANVTLEDACFAFCPNLTKVIFDGDSICLGENVFSDCASLQTIQITDSAHFIQVGELINVPQMSHFKVPNMHKQCEVDILGKTLRITNVVWSQYADGKRYPSVACYIPQEWKANLKSTYSSKENFEWCENITCDQVSQHNYSEDSIYYLVDTVCELPNFDDYALSFIRRNVIYASLPNVTEIKNSLFRNSKLQKIDIPNVTCIRELAFAYSDLNYIDAPNVREIESHAFFKTRNLQKYLQFYFLDSIGKCVFREDTIIALEMPHLRYAARNAFGGLCVDTLILPYSLFYRLDTTNLGEEGLHSTLITDNDYYGINDVDFINSSWMGDVISINHLTQNQCRLNADTGFVDLENRTSKLIIGANVKSPDIKYINYDNLENISVNLLNPTYFAYKNILFCKIGTAYKSILNAPNQKRIFAYQNGYKIQVGDRTREIILFAPYQHKNIFCSEEQKKNITIYFPYGTENYIRNLTKTNDLIGYKNVVEMTYLRTSYYNFAFRFVMNSHYSNYRIPLLLLLMFILCAHSYIKRNFKSSNFKTKLVFFVFYTFFLILGLYIIVSSTLLEEKIPTMQFQLLLYWFFVASSFALWVTYPHYPNRSIIKDALKLLLYGSFYVVGLIWYHDLSTSDLEGIDKKLWTIIMLSVSVLSIVALRILRRNDKVIIDTYLIKHQYRRGLLILLYYVYFVETVIFTIGITEEGAALEFGMMLFYMAMCGGFCIAHWRIRKRMDFKYAEYLRARDQLKYKQSIHYESDYILKRRIHFCHIFAIVSIVIVCVGSIFYNLSYYIAYYIMLCLIALQPILMHVCLAFNHISYSDLIQQYTKEHLLMQELLAEMEVNDDSNSVSQSDAMLIELPFSTLPGGEKEHDRLIAFDIIKLVKKLGWKLVK